MDDEVDGEHVQAAETGQEYAVELTLDLKWDTGAPMPFVISNGFEAAVVFYLDTPAPHWDGSCTAVVDPSSDGEAMLGVIQFTGVHEVRFGGLNDEALNGHPLWGRGLVPYAAHRVVNSSWITEAERRNSVHPQHRGDWHERLNHYILCFHDETLECLAASLHTSRIAGGFGDVVGSVSVRLLS